VGIALWDSGIARYVGMRIYGGDVYGIRDGDECRNGHQREISTHQRSVLVWLGKDVVTERMHRGFLSDQQQFNCAPFLKALLWTWRQN